MPPGVAQEGHLRPVRPRVHDDRELVGARHDVVERITLALRVEVQTEAQHRMLDTEQPRPRRVPSALSRTRAAAWRIEVRRELRAQPEPHVEQTSQPGLTERRQYAAVDPAPFLHLSQRTQVAVEIEVDAVALELRTHAQDDLAERRRTLVRELRAHSAFELGQVHLTLFLEDPLAKLGPRPPLGLDRIEVEHEAHARVPVEALRLALGALDRHRLAVLEIGDVVEHEAAIRRCLPLAPLQRSEAPAAPGVPGLRLEAGNAIQVTADALESAVRACFEIGALLTRLPDEERTIEDRHEPAQEHHEQPEHEQQLDQRDPAHPAGRRSHAFAPCGHAHRDVSRSRKIRVLPSYDHAKRRNVGVRFQPVPRKLLASNAPLP